MQQPEISIHPLIGRLPYRKDWYCPVAGDRVKREGHCSEYEKSEIAKEK